MSDCERTEELLIDTLERDPSERERAELEAHLGCCAACSEMARQNQAIRAAYREAQAEDVGDDVSTVVLAAARREVAGTRRRRRLVLIAAACVAAVLLVVFGRYTGFTSEGTPHGNDPLSRAARLVEDGHFERALEELGPLLAADAGAHPNERLSAMRLRAEALQGLEAWEEAIAAYDELAREFPSEEAAAHERARALAEREEEERLGHLRALGYSE